MSERAARPVAQIRATHDPHLDVVAMLEHYDRAIAVLRDVEWENSYQDEQSCPSCGGEKPDHLKSCALAAVLSSAL